jgi:hypothetical protein
MSGQDEFLESIDGGLNSGQVAQLLELDGEDFGVDAPKDAGALDDANKPQENAPDPKPKETAEEAVTPSGGKPVENPIAPDSAKQGKDVELTPENAVIQSKSGTYTIEYQVLLDERAEANRWRDQAKAKDSRIAELETQLNARVDAGAAPAKTDDAAANEDTRLFGDFSETAMDSGIRKRVDQTVANKVEAALNQALEPVQAALTPIRKQQAELAAEKHLAAIYGKHPDADEIVESQEFSAWMVAQPEYARAACRYVLENGSAAAVIEVFDQFKADAAPSAPASSSTPKDAASVAAKAKEIIEKTQDKASVPASLTDIPGGIPGSSATLREAIIANIKSRSREGRLPSKDGISSRFIVLRTACPWPCGNEEVISNASPTATKRLPCSERRMISIKGSGECDKFPSVSFLTLPSSRKLRRNRWVR